MKKLICCIAVLIFTGFTGAAAFPFSGLKEIKLGPPPAEAGVTLIKALKDRKTNRDMSEKELSLSHLSGILWAANGVNRPDGKRTAPAARNKQMVEIYAVTKEGVYMYDALKNVLKPVKKGDFRAKTGRQGFAISAPLNLVFVADTADYSDLQSSDDEDRAFTMAVIAAGCMMQNAALYCAAEGLACTVRGYVSGEEFGPVIGLKGKKRIIAAQSIGYPAAK